LATGDRLPVGLEAFPGREHNDVVLWIEERRAVIAGDSLADFGRGLEIPAEWLRPDVTREQIVDGLRPLLELPVEFVLPAHGAPTDRAASSARSPEVGAELSAWVRRRRGAASRTTRHRLLSLRCAGHAAKLART
jgi:glyoxylase-like metal-dependent hydrolase (beta-lactamase superfamily II)